MIIEMSSLGEISLQTSWDQCSEVLSDIIHSFR